MLPKINNRAVFLSIAFRLIILTFLMAAGRTADVEDFQLQYKRRLSPALGIATTQLTCTKQLACTLTQTVVQDQDNKKVNFNLTNKEKNDILNWLSELQHQEQGKDDTFRLTWKHGKAIMSHAVNMQNEKPVAIASKIISKLEVHFSK